MTLFFKSISNFFVYRRLFEALKSLFSYSKTNDFPSRILYPQSLFSSSTEALRDFIPFRLIKCRIFDGSFLLTAGASLLVIRSFR